MMSMSFRQLLQELSHQSVQHKVASTFKQTSLEDRERMAQEMELASRYESSNISDAQCRSNYDLNRYSDVVPFNHNRVRLTEGKNSYINATHIKLPDNISTTKYIATQGPLNHSTGDFWQMIWEQKAQSIVMLANPVESGRNKCAVYWPSAAGKPIASRLSNEGTGVLVTLLGERQLEHGNPSVVVRTLMLEHKRHPGESRTVRQLHYTEWPDHGVPLSPVPLFRLLQELNSGKQNATDSGPVVVHCSAGVGRTGTLIIMDAAMQYFTTHDDYAGDLVADAFKSLRKQRTLMVQTQSQLVFCYQAIAYMLNNY
ncbi:Tyrosine-protein phosphatase non-receptor type 2 [Coemansia spiralis]|uniref:Tyrosine-protein phosphatase non-receptor type 2 n=2 Tax=Coemansia TaxID=4863 RepID=A0A9W8KZI3_9FUNG|nr:Tyrosine-protein phosphatase non-receptor type 2 [Coemansia umbellata]KAJ2623314.1 Tyrosine-protein phosphatase non-receptor type 2 [Coemansia sp. RSA 1358]KAJ2678865.1 Tyrosine-protein phosphatase non-receptor type 2 [Coemansia spiralis]